ncbi:hypothetical protein [Porphyrobacter sp. LM 6]|jgi:hypothetical protein|uniref:hypothetical protein n=1 Tax=Porphyrobacter sp. LM 6 TaxID=1896196 RepID=UPI0008464E3B|nr:hypothetical protein [Porphyrobacter sp. LM 6]AOL93526.1 hypothetical protein BG023_11573 [Porphyrobacter sp. LM 6]
MIDYFALALGHGLLAIALLRLVMRDALDTDPLLESLRQEAEDNRKSAGAAARSAARRARSEDGEHADDDPARSSGEAVAQAKARSSSEAVAHKNA